MAAQLWKYTPCPYKQYVGHARSQDNVVLKQIRLWLQEAAEEVVGQYADVLMEAYNGRTARKLGVKQYDRDLAVGFMQLMYEDKADFTNTWRALADVPSAEPGEASTSGANGAVGQNGAGAPGFPAALFKVGAVI